MNNSRPPIRRSACGLYSGLVWRSHPRHLPIGFNVIKIFLRRWVRRLLSSGTGRWVVTLLTNILSSSAGLGSDFDTVPFSCRFQVPYVQEVYPYLLLTWSCWGSDRSACSLLPECEILCYQLCCIAVLNNATECISKCSDTYLQNVTFCHGHERRCVVVWIAFLNQSGWLALSVCCLCVCYTWLLTLEIAFLVAPRSPEVFYSLFKKMWIHCSNDDEIDNSNCRRRRRRYSLLTAVNKWCTMGAELCCRPD